MTRAVELSMRGGAAAPLGATLGGGGVNFAVLAPHAEAVHVCIFDDSGLETARLRLPARCGDVHCGFLSGASAGCRYGLRAEGPWAPELGHRYDPSKLLVDPRATRLDRPFAWTPALAERGVDTAARVPKALVEPPLSPAASANMRPLGLIYELPVRAFTSRHPHVPEAMRGTVAALAQPCIIDHLLQLGVDTIELMPLAAWIDERHLPPLGLANAWGYNPVTFFAPDPRLAPGGMIEIRDTLAKLRAAGLQVILDVVVNHSGESDLEGGTLALRGLDNALYYAHAADGRLVNDTGCGNTLALHRAPVVAWVMDALRHWAGAGFDGFRFDLAAVMGRTEHGFDVDAPMLAAIAQDPVLSRLHLVAEPWDAVGTYRLGGFPHPWREWNDRYRDRVRRFWRGDPHAAGDFATAICGSSDVFAGRRRPPSASVNFIAAHDGFTLHDVVRYAQKDNAANGEENRDGHSGEISWASATPGPDVRALLATVLLSRGTPMLTAGDELGRTQRGNNNAYAQDNAITWLDWEAADRDLMSYVARLAALRRRLEPLRVDEFLEGRDVEGSGAADATWLDSSGAVLGPGHWAQPHFSTFGLLLYRRGERLVLWFNRAAHEVACTLPEARTGRVWRVELDSAADYREGDLSGEALVVAPRTVLVAREVDRSAEKPIPGQRAGATDGEIAALAEAAGIDAEWYEVDGRHHRVSPDSQRALLAAMRIPAATSDDVRSSLLLLRSETAARALPLNVTLAERRQGALPIVLPDSFGRRQLGVRLVAEDGEERKLTVFAGDLADAGALAHDGVHYRRYMLPMPALPAGLYRATLEEFGDVEAQLIVHPSRCFMPDEIREPRRAFGLAAHLYALRDRRDAGIGDLGTLARFAQVTREIGGVTAGINPLHHLFPSDRDRASPYQPSDRRFIDPIYCDLDGLVTTWGGETARATMSACAGDFGTLRARQFVDYPHVWRLKERVLRAVFADCADRPLPALEAFIEAGGNALQMHALFEALASSAGTVDRRRWPAAWRTPAADTLPVLCREFRSEMRFQAFLQWCLADQLEAVRGRAPALGLYRDLAVGVARDGGEVWARPELFAEGVSVGAPPDPFAAAGQVWNLPPVLPRGLQRAGFAPMAELLAANMRAAGALRIDHILGFARQFWVPEGADGTAGAYVRYPLEELVALTALQSVRARCSVVGEDLGTVPAGLRDRLAAADILSYRVLWLERDREGGFLPPQAYPRLAAACLSTHDLPPFLGWTRAADRAERGALEAAIASSGLPQAARDEDLMVEAHAFTAVSPSALMLIQADDIAGETEPLNVPGTDRERPNWRRRIGIDVDALASGDLAQRVIGAVKHKRQP